MRLLPLLLLCGGLAACHDDGHEAYSNFQACYDEHTVAENLSTTEAIVVCCLDHEIDGVTLPCGTSSTDCVAYLNTSLVGPMPAEVSTACDEYLVQAGQ